MYFYYLLPREDLVDDVAGDEVALLDVLLVVESAFSRGILDLDRGLFSWLSSLSSVSESAELSTTEPFGSLLALMLLTLEASLNKSTSVSSSSSSDEAGMISTLITWEEG